MADTANDTIVVELTPQEAQFILACLKGAPISATIVAMPQILAIASSIEHKLTTNPDKA